jgi:gliding motility-associated-like protein
MKKKLLLYLSWIIMGNLKAQKIIQLVSPASGVTSTSATGTSYSWSIGEIATLTVSGSSIITQGQQQPNVKVTPPPIKPVFNNGLTIGDASGKNGVFSIDSIEKFPNNRLTIINRWGEVLFKTDKAYINEWAGTDATGSPVETGTYYYVFYPDINNYPKLNYKGYILVINSK